MQPGEQVLWGLTDESPESEVLEKAFSLIGAIRFIPAATTNEQGGAECRILDFNRLSDGQLYFMTSRGKPTYRQLRHQPRLVLNTLIDRRYSLRLTAQVEEESRPEIWEEFFRLNPGTKLMYRKSFDIVALFRLTRGEGEMFHLYESERIRRLRFAFGGETPRPMTYAITGRCTGCGICRENCVERAIHQGPDGKYFIRYMDCDDCGICYTRCPMAGWALVSHLSDA